MSHITIHGRETSTWRGGEGGVCYNSSVVKKFFTAAGLAGSALLIVLQVSAQTAASAFLSPASTEAFPSINAILDVRDAQGNFLPGLEAASVTVVEDGTPIPASSLTMVETNLQFVLAVNTANSFAIVDETGQTRYHYIIESFRPWAMAAPADGKDDLSLVSPTGVRSLHESDHLQWLNDLERFQPAFQTAVPSLTALQRAIEIASEPGRDLGASRVVLWLTPALGPSFNADMLGLAEQAREAGVRVFVWMIDSNSLFTSEQAATLRALASQTGGSFYAFSGIEPLPDLGVDLGTALRAYRLSYQSQASAAGTHDLYAAVQIGEMTVNSGIQSYDLELKPAVVEIAGLPQQISRRLADRSDPALPFEPTHQELDLNISFPDSIQRELVQATLLVDGQAVAVNQTAPFEHFSWDLSGYTVSTMVMVSVEVTDTLGLSGTSEPLPVQITVEGAPSGFQALFMRYGASLVVFIVLSAAAVLLLVFVLAGRIQPKPLGSRRGKRSRYEDPVTQPLNIRDDSTRQRERNSRKKGVREKKLPPQPNRAAGDQKTAAFLERLESAGELKNGSFLPIGSGETTIGCDAQRAQLHLDHPSIEPLHARVWRDRDGQFFLADLKSTSGTWLNYAPISGSGSRLQHGDLVHFGTVGFRFRIKASEKETHPITVTKKG